MFLPVYLLALLAMPSLSGLYVVCLIVGGGLLVVSTVFGGDHGVDSDVDADFDLDFDADVDLDLDLDVDVGDVDFDAASAGHGVEVGVDHHGALALSTWFSVSFVVYFAAVFGLLGTVLTHMSELSAAWVLAIALACGFTVGQGVHQGLRALKRSGGNSQVSVKDFIHQPARVTVAIKPPSRGEVAVRVGNREHFLAAIVQRPDDSFGVGDAVVIVEYSGGMASVVSRQEHDFTSNT